MVEKRVVDLKATVEHNQQGTNQMYHQDLDLATNLDQFYQYDKLYHQDQMIFLYRQLKNMKKKVYFKLIKFNQ